MSRLSLTEVLQRLEEDCDNDFDGYMDIDINVSDTDSDQGVGDDDAGSVADSVGDCGSGGDMHENGSENDGSNNSGIVEVVEVMRMMTVNPMRVMTVNPASVKVARWMLIMISDVEADEEEGVGVGEGVVVGEVEGVAEVEGEVEGEAEGEVEGADNREEVVLEDACLAVVMMIQQLQFLPFQHLLVDSKDVPRI